MSKSIWHTAKELPTINTDLVYYATFSKNALLGWVNKSGFIVPYDTFYESVMFGNIIKWAYLSDVLALETELDHTRKALDVAVDALKEQQRWIGVIRVSLISHLNNEYGTLFKSYDADPTVVNTKRARDMLNTALEQITALEQKD